MRHTGSRSANPALNTDPPTTQKVYVIPDQRTSNVVSVASDTILLADGYTIDVEDGSRIIKMNGASCERIDLSEITAWR